jgi:hypothetical protein
MEITAFICDVCGVLLKQAFKDIDTDEHYCQTCYEKAKAKDKDMRVCLVSYEDD